MRQIFSIRFFAAVGAVFGLFVLLSAMFGGDEPLAELVNTEPMQREVDLVEQVFIPVLNDFGLGEDGITTGSMELVLDGERSVRVVEGTHGEITCTDLRTVGACAVVADLLGDAVVWFALVPMGQGRTVEFPAIDVLEDERAALVNGWRLPYANVFDRRCDREFVSYREFREELGTEFVSVFSLEENQLIAVVCTDERAEAD